MGKSVFFKSDIHLEHVGGSNVLYFNHSELETWNLYQPKSGTFTVPSWTLIRDFVKTIFWLY